MKLSDIARLAGVSVTTASYVINGKADQRRISPATVTRVQQVVEQYGYQPDQRAAGLRRGQTLTLGFILPDLENPSYARLAKQLEIRARLRGYQLLIACTDDEPDTERQLLSLFRARRCDGLITASCLADDDTPYRRLQAEGLPVVAVDRQLDPSQFCSVVSDDRTASALLTKTLLDTPPREIALIAARPDLVISRERAAGFESALQNFNGKKLIRYGEQFSRTCGRDLMLDLMSELGHMPDAIITTAYVLLEGVFDVFQQQAEGWPSHLRLATFGDAQLLDFVPIKVNGLYQQHELIAEQALNLMLDAIESHHYEPGVHAIPRQLKTRHKD
ncbi:catabolite repressor/activator [Pseudomonas luteola]|uniref:catabolite repressor/activator n=1 Tax=Pseudomonas luteola TaxID=47886 RepID=UPI001EF421FF|nr:catabolite repressor/activator [Pseudomonas luteola]MCG7372560.1 catabolite repressor/activator [Pseudomonas luteola]